MPYLRPNWDDYFMSIAKIIATRSTCDRLRAGALEYGRDPKTNDILIRANSVADGKPYTDNDIARDPTRFSQWPVKGMRPRAATVVISRVDGGPVGG